MPARPPPTNTKGRRAGYGVPEQMMAKEASSACARWRGHKRITGGRPDHSRGAAGQHGEVHDKTPTGGTDGPSDSLWAVDVMAAFFDR